MNKSEITEEMHLEKEWFIQAKGQTIDTLPAFINHIMGDYAHDYGTICHALSACALAAAWAANSHPQGGITGFQAGCVMLDFVIQWMYSSNKCGLRLVNYDNMLYPQYSGEFQKKIKKSTWSAVQKRAKELLEERGGANKSVIEHWESIARGNVPFGYIVQGE